MVVFLLAPVASAIGAAAKATKPSKIGVVMLITTATNNSETKVKRRST